MHNVFPQPWPTAPAHCISCDAEALDAAHRLAEVLRGRYAVPAEDQISPAVWSRASIAALRTALIISARGPRAAAPPPGAAPAIQSAPASPRFNAAADDPG